MSIGHFPFFSAMSWFSRPFLTDSTFAQDGMLFCSRRYCFQIVVAGCTLVIGKAVRWISKATNIPKTVFKLAALRSCLILETAWRWQPGCWSDLKSAKRRLMALWNMLRSNKCGDKTTFPAAVFALLFENDVFHNQWRSQGKGVDFFNFSKFRTMITVV